jgi:hypothetical protein
MLGAQLLILPPESSASDKADKIHEVQLHALNFMFVASSLSPLCLAI